MGKFPGRRHGNPLQYSCLENSIDKRAWWAAVHRLAKSRTRLKWLSTHTRILPQLSFRNLILSHLCMIYSTSTPDYRTFLNFFRVFFKLLIGFNSYLSLWCSSVLLQHVFTNLWSLFFWSFSFIFYVMFQLSLIQIYLSFLIIIFFSVSYYLFVDNFLLPFSISFKFI